MKDRGKRIASNERNKRKRLRQVQSHGDAQPVSGEEKWVKRFINHGKLCSCSVCGNRRKHDGETLQERKSKDSWWPYDTTP